MKFKANPNEIQGKSKLISVLALLVICWEEVSTGWEPTTSELIFFLQRVALKNMNQIYIKTKINGNWLEPTTSELMKKSKS